MADREPSPATTLPTAERAEEGDSLLREIAAAPSLEVPIDIATMVLLEPGTIVDGKFKIEERLGAGGMGVVYAADDLALGRKVAIKLMRLERSIGRPGERLPEVFDREARATARLNHPNVVTLHQFGNWNGILYLVLERLRGETLSARLERGQLPLLDALAIMEQVANALVHTHAAGVIHRDLKPANVFLLADGGVKVLDFGVSGLGHHAPEPDSTTTTEPRATMSHAGTPGYMAPEQWLGEAQDSRTDLWAVGVMVYQLVTGTLPFGLVEAARSVDVAPLATKLPPEASELVPLVTKCLTIRREARASDAAEVARALHEIRRRLDPTLAPAVQPRSLASRVVRGSAAVMGVAAIAITTAALWPREAASSKCDGAEKQLAGIWDAQTRARLAAKFEALGPNGASTWTAVAMTVDRYAREWVAMREQSCRASNAPTAPATTKCLDERRDGLARFVREHEDVAADQLVWTLAAAQALLPVVDCADQDYLARWAPITSTGLRTDRGVVRAAITIDGHGLDVVHSAVPFGDDIVLTGVATEGATFAGKPVDNPGTVIARVASNGSRTWSVTNKDMRVIELARGNSSDVLLAGFYSAATTFAGKSLAAPSGGNDCFAASLDATTGELRWFVPCGTTQGGEVRAVGSDRDGNLYVAGDFGGHATFGGSHEIDADAHPTMVPFVASWSATGALRWVTAGHGTGSSRSKGLAVDGDAVIMGARVTGSGWLGDKELREGGCVVARLDRTTGAIRWVRELAILQCELADVAVAGDRVAAVGRYRGHGAWIEELAAGDGADRWRARFGTHDQEGISSAVYTTTGALTVTGFFGGPSLAIDSEILHGNGADEIFVASFDDTGKLLGARSFGGAGHDRPRWIGQGSGSAVLLAGRFENSVRLDTRELRATGAADGVLLELQLPWLQVTSAPSARSH